MNVVKMSILPKAMYALKATPTKIPMASFAELEKRILIFVWNRKGPGIAKAILREESRLEASCSPTSNCIMKSPKQCVVLAQKQTQRPEEQTREPRNKPTRMW